MPAKPAAIERFIILNGLDGASTGISASGTA